MSPPIPKHSAYKQHTLGAWSVCASSLSTHIKSLRLHVTSPHHITVKEQWAMPWYHNADSRMHNLEDSENHSSQCYQRLSNHDDSTLWASLESSITYSELSVRASNTFHRRYARLSSFIFPIRIRAVLLTRLPGCIKTLALRLDLIPIRLWCCYRLSAYLQLRPKTKREAPKAKP